MYTFKNIQRIIIECPILQKLKIAGMFPTIAFSFVHLDGDTCHF